ncbi:MAG: hypothetical protein QOD32_100 [Pyrinomonadaceae bacterium]|jgi:hypothetical protein|nr:hypothetical protein [Pyrinomonadaceae bacterium]
MAEIFQSHERLNQDTRTPWMLRTLGASLAAHALFLASVVYVPAVRDTFRLASTLSGLRFVEEDYTKTAVGQRADVMLNFADNKLYYPPGYFSQTALPAPDAPQLVEEFRPQPASRPKIVKVKPTPTPEVSPTPDDAAATDDATAKKEGDPAGDPAASPSPGATPQSAEEAERIAKEANVEKFPTINTKPLTDLLKQGKQMRDAGEIDLSGNLEMEFEGDRQEDGRLTNVEVTGAAASNPKLVQLSKDFISAISDSKVLAALKGTRHLKMKVKLDDKEIAVRVLTEMASADEASTMSNGYNGLLWIGAQSKKGKDEEAIFKSVQIAAEAKQIVLTFNMPRKAAGDLLTKLIKKNEVTTAPTATPPPS